MNAPRIVVQFSTLTRTELQMRAPAATRMHFFAIWGVSVVLSATRQLLHRITEALNDGPQFQFECCGGSFTLASTSNRMANIEANFHRFSSPKFRSTHLQSRQ
jgi:hypothetical protein